VEAGTRSAAARRALPWAARRKAAARQGRAFRGSRGTTNIGVYHLFKDSRRKLSVLVCAPTGRTEMAGRDRHCGWLKWL
jgi:hypothetical protein